MEKVNRIPRWLFWSLFVISLLVFAYSAAGKYFPELRLPGFPIYPYVILFCISVVFVRYRMVSPLIFLIVIVSLLNFGFPVFRFILFSHLPGLAWQIGASIAFVLSSIAIFNALHGFLTIWFLPSRRRATDQETVLVALKAFVPGLLLFMALLSPFYWGAIQPGSSDDAVQIEAYHIDQVYEEKLTAATADREAARQYFLAGKEAAIKGTIAGHEEALTSYDLAIDLIPEFSTVYAEKAYSFFAMYVIHKANDRFDLAGENYNYALAQLAIAKEYNDRNPTIFAIESIIKFERKDFSRARRLLDSALVLSDTAGKTDRILLSMAYQEKKNVEQVSYLLGIHEKISPNSPEIHNLLGLAYYQIGNMKTAQSFLDRAVTLNPDYEEAQLNLALLSSEKQAVFTQIKNQNADFYPLADEYSTLFRIEVILRWVYVILIILWFVQIFRLSGAANEQANSRNAEKVNNELSQKIALWLLIVFLTIAGSYALFEWYIHRGEGINTLTHMFPVIFPFF